jgi:hypothetical protein
MTPVSRSTLNACGGLRGCLQRCRPDRDLSRLWIDGLRQHAPTRRKSGITVLEDKPSAPEQRTSAGSKRTTGSQATVRSSTASHRRRVGDHRRLTHCQPPSEHLPERRHSGPVPSDRHTAADQGARVHSQTNPRTSWEPLGCPPPLYRGTRTLPQQPPDGFWEA